MEPIELILPIRDAGHDAMNLLNERPGLRQKVAGFYLKALLGVPPEDLLEAFTIDNADLPNHIFEEVADLITTMLCELSLVESRVKDTFIEKAASVKPNEVDLIILGPTYFCLRIN